MKASDICVGDWFKAVDYNSPFRITAIYDDVVQTQADYQSEIDGNWYSEAEIKDLVPIELTEEILVKNGFVCTQDKEWPEVLYWELETDEEYFAIDENRLTDYVFYNYAGIHIYYAHQLQHLLRLCGIEKELTI